VLGSRTDRRFPRALSMAFVDAVRITTNRTEARSKAFIATARPDEGASTCA
jgi:hypothetical protein